MSASSAVSAVVPAREHVLHALYEAAELEHTLMCTYLYAAFSLTSGQAEGLSAEEAEAVMRWRRVILDVAIEEMGHLTAVWNITAALGGAPRFGRGNFPIDPGYLPAGLVVKLAPFNAKVLQHFIHLERPHGSSEPEGDGFAPERAYVRETRGSRLTPMGVDYETVGEFYAAISADLQALAAGIGEEQMFCGDPALQLSSHELDLKGATPVRCLKSALAAFATIVEQGEGAPEHSEGSHFQKFLNIRQEYEALLAKNPNFSPAVPAAYNPVLRRPPRPEGRVWIEDQQAVQTVDLANAAYGLMLRAMAYAYTLPSPSPEKAVVVESAIALMRVMTVLGEHAARLPAGPSNPDCNAGISFLALRDTAALQSGEPARRFLIERFAELAAVAGNLPTSGDDRASRSKALLDHLSANVARRLGDPKLSAPAPSVPQNAGPPPTAPISAASSAELEAAHGIEAAESDGLTLLFEGKRCIHARFCVTGAPTVFLANVVGPWLHPETMGVEGLVAIAHACPSGAIRYHRKDGGADETAPPVNLAAIREAGPYAFRAPLLIDGEEIGYRATLCRCGASKNKPFCDGSHHEIGFSASGEPATGKTDALAQRDGPLMIDPQIDGPLQVRGNLEITSGTGRIVARIETARLCRCGASGNKPFCDGSHAKVGFRSS